MENKINSTEYLMTAIKEMEDQFNGLQRLIEEVKDSATWAKAYAKMNYLHGMLAGIYFVVNTMEECSTNETLQDVLDQYEDRLKNKVELLRAMKAGYWKNNE